MTFSTLRRTRSPSGSQAKMPGRLATDVAGTHQQPVAGDLGVGGVLTQGADEQVGQTGGHRVKPRMDAGVTRACRPDRACARRSPARGRRPRPARSARRAPRRATRWTARRRGRRAAAPGLAGCRLRLRFPGLTRCRRRLTAPRSGRASGTAAVAALPAGSGVGDADGFGRRRGGRVRGRRGRRIRGRRPGPRGSASGSPTDPASASSGSAAAVLSAVSCASCSPWSASSELSSAV